MTVTFSCKCGHVHRIAINSRWRWKCGIKYRVDEHGHLFDESKGTLPGDRDYLKNLTETKKQWTITRAELAAGVFAVTLFIRAGYVASRSEGYRLIKQGGLYINTKQLHDRAYKVTLDDVIDGRVEVRVGRWRKMREFKVVES